MADINIRNVPDGLIVELRVQSAKAGKTLKAFCLDALRDVLKPEGISTREQYPSRMVNPSSAPSYRKPHNVNACRIYGCLLCKALKV